MGTTASVSVEDNVSFTCCAVLVTVGGNIVLLRLSDLSVIRDDVLVVSL